MSVSAARRASGSRAAVVERRRPSPSAPRDRPRARPRVGAGSPGASTRMSLSTSARLIPVLDGRLRVVRHDDHRVLLEERLGAAGHVHDPLERAVRLGDRAHLAVRADLVRVGVVVRQREEQEVEQVVLDEVARRRSPCGGRAGPACRAPRCSRCRASRTGPRRRARARRRPGGGTARPRRSAGRRSRPTGRGACGRGRSGRWCRRSGGRRRRGARRRSGARGSGARGSCCRPCRRASGRSRTRAWRGATSRTRRSAPRRGGTSSSTGCGARPGP